MHATQAVCGLSGRCPYKTRSARPASWKTCGAGPGWWGWKSPPAWGDAPEEPVPRNPSGTRDRGPQKSRSDFWGGLGDDFFLPFWEAADALGLAVFVHPTGSGLGIQALGDYYLWNTVGNPVETAVTAAHMVLSGFLERYVRLTVILPHGGGVLPALRGRLRHAHGFQPLARSRLRGDVDACLRRFFYDTVTHDAVLLRQLVEWVGPGQVVLGSDWPFDMGLEDPVGFVRSAGLGVETEPRVLGENAVRILGLEVRGEHG